MQERDPLILDLIPQRDPFLFLDQIIELDEKKIVATYYVTGKEFFLEGHFPGQPIVPGVILQEACFQSGAALMGHKGKGEKAKIGVVSRVQDVKFKKLVKPHDELKIETKLDEILSNAFYMNSKIYVNDKIVTILKFTGSLVEI